MAPIPNLTLTSFMVMMLSCLLLLSPGGLCSSATNVLYSDLGGAVLPNGQSLSYGGYSLTMRKDCNLLLLDGTNYLWSSQTGDQGTNCELTLTSTGLLKINDLDGPAVIWTGGKQSAEGRYALVVKSDGTIHIYGPILWSPNPKTVNTASGPPFSNDEGTMNSTLWTGQVARGTIIQNEHYKLVLQNNCNLILSDKHTGEVVWSTNTLSRECSVTLHDYGVLTIKNDKSREVWRSGPGGPLLSDYVLALRPDGMLAIYGPSTWVRPEVTKQMTGDAAAKKYWNIIATAVGK